MKHKLWVASLMILSACTLMACSHTTKKDTVASSTKESSSKVEKKTSSSSSKDNVSTKKTLPVKKPSGLEMQIMVTSIFQVNGINLLILVGLRRSNTQMEVPITLSPWTALRERRQKSPLILNLMQNF